MGIMPGDVPPVPFPVASVDLRGYLSSSMLGSVSDTRLQILLSGSAFVPRPPIVARAASPALIFCVEN